MGSFDPITHRVARDAPAERAGTRRARVLPFLVRIALGGAALGAVGPAVGASDAGRVLSCDTHEGEPALLSRASVAARRVSKHVLQLRLAHGSRRFVDRPPYDEDGDTGGVRWAYCGFDAQGGAHLVGRTDEFSYSGQLVLHKTGRRIPAGHTVSFAPDAKRFLAIEQHAGADGEHWTVRELAGRPIWNGYAGTLAEVDRVHVVVSSFEHPAWSRRGELTAHYACQSARQGGSVILARTSSGQWGWRGHGPCR